MKVFFTKTVLVSAMLSALYTTHADAIDFFKSSVAPPTTSGSVVTIQSTTTDNQQQQVNLDIFQQPVGTELNISLPEGDKILVISDLTTTEEGNVTLVGYIKGEDYELKSVIVYTDGLVFGKIQTQDQTYQVDTGNFNSFFQVEKLPEPEGSQDSLPVPLDAVQAIATHKQLARDMFKELEAAVSTEMVTVDVMVVYSDEYATSKGSSLNNSLDYLIQMTNQAYKDSGVFIQLRLVKTKNVAYPDSTAITTALDNLFNNSGVFSTIEADRTASGADIVVFLRGYNGGSACGLGYVTGGSSSSVAAYARFGYSVVESGSKGGYYCTDLSFPHEIGHNFGATHNIENSQGPGVFPYSYGYGINGIFGDIMSYFSPRVAKFSNPDVICSGTYKCGVANQADVARSFNTVRFDIAAWKAATVNVPAPITNIAIAVTKQGEGTVTSTDGKVNCGTVCNTSYPSSANQLTLNAVPASGYTFTGWSKDCSGTSPSCNLSLVSSKNVSATFTAIPKVIYTLAVTKTGSGTVSSSDGSIVCGSVCTKNVNQGTAITLTSNATTGNRFVRWEGACQGTSATCSVTVNGNVSVNAVYEVIPPVTPSFSVYITKSSFGNITSADGKINCGSKGTVCDASYPKNTIVTIQAIATDPTMKFMKWGQDCYGNAPVCKLTLNANKVVGFTYTTK